MRTIFITFIISLVFFGLFRFMLDNLEVISPESIEIVKEKYQVETQTEFMKLFDDMKNAGVVYEILNRGNFHAIVIVFVLFISTTFLTIHLFVDKMFFKKFYENASFSIGIRRSVLFMILAFTIIYLRVFGILTLVTVGVTSVLVIFVEFIFIQLNRNTDNDGVEGNDSTLDPAPIRQEDYQDGRVRDDKTLDNNIYNE